MGHVAVAQVVYYGAVVQGAGCGRHHEAANVRVWQVALKVAYLRPADAAEAQFTPAHKQVSAEGTCQAV